ncbi:MAG: non-homologous end-joining DNA ligase [bacterium]|nr:non-homologous end-joining DNA ligase [Acidimicrobiia bacterium]MCY4650918.1 non-homologous end-joining DNA ligase [bacterium]
MPNRPATASGYGPPPILFGVSGPAPPDDSDDLGFLDDLSAQGISSYEFSFVKGFPWKEARCARFGAQAAQQGFRVSAHAPYFAVLTAEEPDKARMCLSALEHTMKLGKDLRAPLIVAHAGHLKGREPGQVMDLIRGRLDALAPKVADLGVGLGLETAGRQGAFGTLGDIALLASEFSFVRPVIDWAHLHALSGGGLVGKERFRTVLSFLKDSFPAWMLSPLHTHFTDNRFGPAGEISHVPYGQGTLRIGPLVEAAFESGISMVVISEAREWESHLAIGAELREAAGGLEATPRLGRRAASGLVSFPDPVGVEPVDDRFRPIKANRAVTLSNLAKPFFPNGYTKGDLISYYASIAPTLLPHLRDRPLSMSRYPNGIGGPSFYEKRAPGHQPEWMRTLPVDSRSAGGEIPFLCADHPESVLWFANMGCVEVHPFHSRHPQLHHPDWAVFDFDPAQGASWSQVVAGVRLLGVALERLGLRSFPKLSGSRGMHVYLPLRPVYTHARVRRFVKSVADVLVAANPDDLTLAWDKRHRTGKVFIDHNRNAFGQTISSVYSVRPLRGAPVSAPLLWDEVGQFANGDINIANLWERLSSYGDLFLGVLNGDQTLEAAEQALQLGPMPE